MISVIVPVYKVEQQLPICIQSILKQTHTDLELILINDGSPDKCGNICDQFAQEDKRIKVIHKENGGLSSARNTGINHATGEYLMFIDSDDCIHARMLEHLYHHARKYASDIVLCDYSSFYEQDRKSIIEQKELKGEAVNYSNVEALQNIYSNKGGNFIVVWNKLYKRKLFKDLRFEEGRIFEDEFLAHRILYKCRIITYIPITLYYYLQRDNSIMRSGISVKKFKDAIAAYEDRIEFFEEIEEKELKNIEGKGLIKGFISYYLDARKDNPTEGKELKKIKVNFHSKISLLLAKPLFNKREKVMWTLFILFPQFYGWGLYVNTKLRA